MDCDVGVYGGKVVAKAVKKMRLMFGVYSVLRLQCSGITMGVLCVV